MPAVVAHRQNASAFRGGLHESRGGLHACNQTLGYDTGKLYSRRGYDTVGIHDITLTAASEHDLGSSEANHIGAFDIHHPS